MRDTRLPRLGVLAVCLTVGACSGATDPKPTDLSPRELANTFADAWVANDVETMRALVCPGSPDPGTDDPFPFRDAAITGPPSKEPNPDAGAGITEPAPDYYVPFEGTDEAGDATGTVDLTFGTNETSPCVENYGMARDLPDE